jgi:CIC family chloride channel protein
LVATIVRKARDLTWAQLGKRTPSENAFLLLLPVVGLLVGLTSVGIAHFLAYVQKLFWGSGGSLTHAAELNPISLRVLIPVVGALICGIIGLTFKVETRGGGTAGMIQAIALKGGFISLDRTLPRVSAAIMTIASGGSLGREGPMAILASAVGSRLGRSFKLSPQQVRVVVCAAAASALAAVYNAPIGGSLFALEILIGSFALEVLGPVVVAAVISTWVFRSCEGNLPRFAIPRYELVSGWELPGYLVLGVVCGIVSLIFIKLLYGSVDVFEKLPLPRWLKPALGAALLGVIGIYWPHVFGNGYDPVNMVLNGQLPLQLLLILPAAKLLATALSFGSGGAGGLFTPSMMIGALTGGLFGYGVHALFPQYTAEHGAYALVGMGAIIAGTTHAPLTAIMMIFEQTNSYQIVLPLMLVCVISHVTVRLFRANSLEEEALRRRGVKLPRGPEGGVMQTMRVAEVMHDEVVAVQEAAPFTEVVDRFLKEPHNNLYVVNADGRLIGAIRLHALKDVLQQRDTLPMVVARDLVDESFPFVMPDQKLADTMDTFWRESAERLPVLNNAHDRRLVGWMSKRDLIGVYSQEILQKRQVLGRFITRSGDEQRETFVELPEGFELRTVELPAGHEGRTLAQLSPRSAYGVHVLALNRRDPTTARETVQIPGPDLRLETGDRLVVIGRFEGIAQFMAALALPA